MIVAARTISQGSLVAALLLAGCGGKDGDTANTANTEDGSSTTSATSGTTAGGTSTTAGATGSGTETGPTSSATVSTGTATDTGSTTTGTGSASSTGAGSEDCDVGVSYDGIEEGCDLFLECPRAPIRHYSCDVDTCVCMVADMTTMECPVADACDERDATKLIDSARDCCGWDL